MIKTAKQYNNCKKQLTETQRALDFFKQTSPSTLSKEDLVIQIALLEGRIEELNAEISEYEQLESGELDVLEAYTIFQLSDIISKARLAKGWTHKKLAEELGIDEQQIQRYEASDFESAKWSRILEVIYALDLDLRFESIFLGNANAISNNEPTFDLDGYEYLNEKEEKMRTGSERLFNF